MFPLGKASRLLLPNQFPNVTFIELITIIWHLGSLSSLILFINKKITGATRQLNAHSEMMDENCGTKFFNVLNRNTNSG